MKKQILFLFVLSTHFSFAHARVPKSVAKAASQRTPSQEKPCSRFTAGSIVQEPKNLFSDKGRLDLSLTYETDVDEDGNTEFCYRLPSGERSPTLHVQPGDILTMTLTNKTPTEVSTAGTKMAPMKDACGPADMMDNSSTNIHFHGANVPPVCHQDDSLNTLINSGQSFTYSLHIPKDEPAGLYWYHPHIHGTSEAALLGGASGAIVVEGMQHFQHHVAGLRERVLIFRDNLVPDAPKPSEKVPTWDLSLNFVPIPYPKYPAAVIQMRPGDRELWRVLNASADTILDLQLTFDGIVQNIAVVGMDGVPTSSQDEDVDGHEVIKKHLFLPPAARVEFIAVAPRKKVKKAELSTLAIQTGPAGDSDPARPLASIQVSKDAPAQLVRLPHEFHIPLISRFKKVQKSNIDTKRKLYFSEVISNPADPSSPTDFFITVDDGKAKPQKFDMSLGPAITVTQGSVEEWTIENRSTENHEFHIHQIHFLLAARNGVAVAKDDQQFLDMVDVPFWSGDKKDPYPSVTLQMDFSGDIAGDFVYHCHILGHEDNGMMAKIRVLPKR